MPTLTGSIGKCPKTTSGKHYWYRYTLLADGMFRPTCAACGLVDDGETNAKDK